MGVVGPLLRGNLCRFPWCSFQLTLPCSSATFEALEGENQQAKERCKTTEAKVQQAGNASRRATKGEGCEMWWYQKIYMKIIYHISISYHVLGGVWGFAFWQFGARQALGGVPPEAQEGCGSNAGPIGRWGLRQGVIKWEPIISGVTFLYPL